MEVCLYCALKEHLDPELAAPLLYSRDLLSAAFSCRQQPRRKPRDQVVADLIDALDTRREGSLRDLLECFSECTTNLSLLRRLVKCNKINNIHSCKCNEATKGECNDRKDNSVQRSSSSDAPLMTMATDSGKSTFDSHKSVSSGDIPVAITSWGSTTGTQHRLTLYSIAIVNFFTNGNYNDADKYASVLSRCHHKNPDVKTCILAMKMMKCYCRGELTEALLIVRKLHGQLAKCNSGSFIRSHAAAIEAGVYTRSSMHDDAEAVLKEAFIDAEGQPANRAVGLLHQRKASLLLHHSNPLVSKKIYKEPDEESYRQAAFHMKTAHRYYLDHVSCDVSTWKTPLDLCYWILLEYVFILLRCCVAGHFSHRWQKGLPADHWKWINDALQKVESNKDILTKRRLVYYYLALCDREIRLAEDACLARHDVRCSDTEAALDDMMRLAKEYANSAHDIATSGKPTLAVYAERRLEQISRIEAAYGNTPLQNQSQSAGSLASYSHQSHSNGPSPTSGFTLGRDEHGNHTLAAAACPMGYRGSINQHALGQPGPFHPDHASGLSEVSSSEDVAYTMRKVYSSQLRKPTSSGSSLSLSLHADDSLESDQGGNSWAYVGYDSSIGHEQGSHSVISDANEFHDIHGDRPALMPVEDIDNARESYESTEGEEHGSSSFSTSGTSN